MPIHTPEAVPPTPLAGVTDHVPQLLRLLHLASPALPIGAFHFSQGLEYAVEAGWVSDEASALEWIDGIASGSLATLDLPVLQRLLLAWTENDLPAVSHWNAFLIAARETGELRLEDRHLGSALLRVLAEFSLTTTLFAGATPRAPASVSYAAAFALACARWNIGTHAALQTYSWAWAENQVLAAVKLVPLGQSAGQRMLHALCSRISRMTEDAHKITDSDIGVCTSLSAVASGRHETQYTRLFRS